MVLHRSTALTVGTSDLFQFTVNTATVLVKDMELHQIGSVHSAELRGKTLVLVTLCSTLTWLPGLARVFAPPGEVCARLTQACVVPASGDDWQLRAAGGALVKRIYVSAGSAGAPAIAVPHLRRWT